MITQNASKESRLTQAQLKDLLTYNPDTGVFTWRVQRRGCAKAGDAAGTWAKSGYVIISVNGLDYLAHRLAWLYVHGEWPPETIDHKFGATSDNRISELRPLSLRLNGANRTRANKDNMSGELGAHKRRDGRYSASIRVDGRLIHLGYYGTAESASAAYTEAQTIYYPEIFVSGPTPTLDEYAAKMASRASESAITFNGETKSPAEWGRQFGIRPALLRQRMGRDGLTFEDAVSKPLRTWPSMALKACNAD